MGGMEHAVDPLLSIGLAMVGGYWRWLSMRRLVGHGSLHVNRQTVREEGASHRYNDSRTHNPAEGKFRR